MRKEEEEEEEEEEEGEGEEEEQKCMFCVMESTVFGFLRFWYGD